MKTDFNNANCFMFHEAKVESIEENGNTLVIYLKNVYAYSLTAVNPKECSQNIPLMKITAGNYTILKSNISYNNIYSREIIDSTIGDNTLTFMWGDETEFFSFAFENLYFEWEKADDNGIDYYYIAKKHFKNNDYITTLSYLKTAAGLEEHYSIYELMYRCFEALDNSDKAYESICRAYSLTQKNDRVFYEYALMQYKYKNDTESAVKVLRKLLERNKTYKAAAILLKQISENMLSK